MNTQRFLGITALAISSLPGYGQQLPSSTEAQLVSRVFTGYRVASKNQKISGMAKGMDAKGNSNYASDICIIPDGPNSRVHTGFISRDECASYRPAARMPIDKGESLQENGVVWLRASLMCGQLEHQAAPINVTPSMARCIVGTMLAAQSGPEGAKSAAPQPKKQGK